MSYRFVVENGELHAVPVDNQPAATLAHKLYAVGTRIIFTRAIESTQSIAVAIG